MSDAAVKEESHPISRTSARKNLTFNVFASGVTAIMSIAMAPLYLHLLGKEAFGLVALFNGLIAIAALFESGITAAISRQLARIDQCDRKETREAMSTFEMVFTIIGVVLGCCICLGGPSFARTWLNPGSLDQATISWSMIWLGIGFIGRWNISYYTAGLNGLERQIGLSLLAVGMAVIQYIGVVVILWMIGATPPVFFAYLAACGLVHMLVLRWMVWRLVGWNSGCRRWHPAALRSLRSFASGMTFISLTAIILTQADKIILSRLMPLAGFGVYSFAANTAAGTSRVIGPIFNAVYPRLTRLVGSGMKVEASEFYQLSAQVVACIMIPPVVVLVVFVAPILRLWTRNPELTVEVAPLLCWFLLGNLLNALVNVPFALQLSHGWTKLVIWSNILSIFVLIPSAIVAYQLWGPIGVVMVWFVLNLGYVVGVVPIMHHCLAWPGLRAWYLYAVVMPVLCTVAISITLSAWCHAASDVIQVLVAGGAIILSMGLVVGLAPAVRRMIGPYVSMMRQRPSP